MEKHSFKEWVATTRYWSFTVSTMPLIVTFTYLFAKGQVPSGVLPWVVLLLSLLGVVLLHAAGNLLSDWFDFRSGVDNKEAFAVPNLVFGKFQPREYLVLSIALFALGIIVGLCIVALSGTGVLIVGAIGVLLTALYSFFKFHALGDLDIFIIFGVLTAFALWGIFWIGDKLSALMFDFARPEVDAVYAMKTGLPSWAIALLLLVLIGPAEELFWRGYVQRTLARLMPGKRAADLALVVTALVYALVHI